MNRWTIPNLLAQGAQGDDGLSRIVLWVGVLVVMVVAAVVVLLKVRRGLLGSSDDESPDGLTLHDLRTLHQQGKLTSEEYERAKAAIIGSAAKAIGDAAAANPFKSRRASAGNKPDKPSH